MPPLPFEGARIQRERITKQDIVKFGATVGCQGCNAIKDNKRAQAHSDRCRERVERCLRITPQGAERMHRRNEVINEALAEEVRRADQRKRRADDAAPKMPEPEPATLAALDPKECPVEPDPYPKGRLLMKSAPSAASHSGQHKEKDSAMNTEAGTQFRDPMEMSTVGGTRSPTALPANTRRRVSTHSEFVAVTAQEAIDGSREKVMRILSVEQVELGNIIKLSIMGQVLKWAR